MPEQRPKPVVLIMCDGLGVAPDTEGNGVSRADTPVFKELIQKYPSMTLRASGEEVGLSWGEMGNSEVGHLTAGAGTVLFQSLPRLAHAIDSGGFFEMPAFIEAANHVKKTGGKLHLMGLLSSGKVHGMDTHAHALLDFAKRQGLSKVYIHAFLDGRDSLYNSGVDFVATLLAKMKEIKIGKLASMAGRYFAMDRDNRFDRVEAAYRCITEGKGEKATDPIEALKASYAKEVYDEQIPPTVMMDGDKPVAVVEEGDAVIFWNYRSDRARELARAFVLDEDPGFKREKIKNLKFITMMEYEAGLPLTVAFPPQTVVMPLARVISEAGLKQLHIAETEKYAHVTFFFNGTREDPFTGEDRAIIPSPKVSSYDQKPEMSAYELTDRVIKEIREEKYDFIVLNYANPDMVAHTGNLKATIAAMKVVDECLGKVIDAVLSKGGVVLITADHGNAEEVLNLQTGDIDKEHSTNPIPLIIVGKQYEGQFGPNGPVTDLALIPPVGMLSDVAPTVLRIMGLTQPVEMTGAPLI
ncbi:MAG: 2,3-bisphosphoglycerate-independent phosphoglycerate mutase [bacterium]